MPFQPDPVWLLARVFGPAAGFLLTLVSAAGSADFQTLKGHGGPVMDIDVSLETGQVATASFDNSVGIWKDRVPQWLEGHAAAVKVVQFLDGSHLVSGGDDNELILWNTRNNSNRVLEGHTAKIMGLAVSPDKTTIASASWDARVGLWPVAAASRLILPDMQPG